MVDLTVDGFDGDGREQEIMSEAADDGDEKHAETGVCLWDDASERGDAAMVVSSITKVLVL